MTVKARPHLAKKRLDVLLVERGLIESRQKAQAIILAGEVRVNGQRAEKTGATFPVDAQVGLRRCASIKPAPSDLATP